MEHINQFAIQGEEGTGYEGPEKGDFNCYNCKYWNKLTKSCGEENVMKKSKRPHLPSGRVKVDRFGCCEYVFRMGRKREDAHR